MTNHKTCDVLECVCGVPWEPDSEQFGCWSCGSTSPSTEEIEMNETDKTYWRNALLSALDSIDRYDVLTPTELDAVATHLATNKSLRYETVEKIEEAG